MNRQTALTALLVTLGGLAAAHGWWHVVVTGAVGGGVLFWTSYATRMGEFVARDAPERALRRERRIAYCIVAAAACVRGGPAARDVGREALTWLDDIEDGGARPGRLLVEAVLLALHLGRQLEDRLAIAEADELPMVITNVADEFDRVIPSNLNRVFVAPKDGEIITWSGDITISVKDGQRRLRALDMIYRTHRREAAPRREDPEPPR